MSSDLGGDAGAPIVREDLELIFEHFAREGAQRPRRIGIEAEWLPVDPATGRARGYTGGVELVFTALLARGFTDPSDAPRPTHLRRGPLAVNVEPGAQLEVSGSPCDDLHQVREELDELTVLAREASIEAGFTLIAHGVHPVSLAHEIEQVPKRRYGYMVEHFLEHGGARFRDMMRLTGAVQVSLDFQSEAEAGDMLRAALVLSPVVAALTANSPVFGGRPTGRQSERTAIWLETDAARSGALVAGFCRPFSFGRLVEEVLDVPAILVRADDGGVAAAGSRPFRALLAEGVHGRPVTLADWELHLSSIFTDARLKRVIECRAADAPPPDASLAVAALYTALLYDAGARASVADLLAPIATPESYHQAMAEAAERGMRGEAFPGALLGDLARAVVQLARGVLAARRRDEERYLDPLAEVAESGISFADRALEAFRKGGASALVRAAAI